MSRAPQGGRPPCHASSENKALDQSTPPAFLAPQPVSQPTPEPPAATAGLKLASNGGHGTLEALRVSQILDDRGIPCCFCGVSALIYYGAGRVRDDWELCVPSDLFQQAESALKSEPHSREYISVAPRDRFQPGSLIHTYPRFRSRGVAFYFVLVPSYDIHLAVDDPSALQRSPNGLPYPKLHVLIQSFLDTYDEVSLCDVVDGSDVSEEWGVQNLDLEGTNDVEWAKWKNQLIDERRGSGSSFLGGCVPVRPFAKREFWRWVVTTKEGRLGWTHPEGLFSTRFRLRGSLDPWLTPQPCS